MPKGLELIYSFIHQAFFVGTLPHQNLLKMTAKFMRERHFGTEILQLQSVPNARSFQTFEN